MPVTPANVFRRFFASATDVMMSSRIAGWLGDAFTQYADGSRDELDEPYFVQSATNASPIEITVDRNHPYQDNDRVIVGEVTGNFAANGTWVVTRTGNTTFTLNDSAGDGIYTGAGKTHLILNTATWNYQVKGNQDGMLIRAGISQDAGKSMIICFDPYGQPIFAIPVTGGPSVFGDDFRMFKGFDIFNSFFKVLGANTHGLDTYAGGLVLGYNNGVTDGAVPLYAGTGAPSSTNPVTSPTNGSFYFRKDTSDIYKRASGAWSLVATSVTFGSTAGTSAEGNAVVSSLNSKTRDTVVTGSTLALPRQPSSRAVLAKRTSAACRLVIVGASTAQGIGASTPRNRFIDRFGELMHVAYPVSGVTGGYHVRVADDTGVTFSGTHSTNTDGLGLSSATLSASATLSYTDSACTALTVKYAQGPGSLAFTVKVDALTAVTVTPNTSGTANRQDGSYITPSVASGSHTFLITATNACVINAIYVHKGDEAAGVQVWNGGKSGAVITDHAANAGFLQRIGELAPGVVVIMPGGNDYPAQGPVATFTSNIEALIAAIRAACVKDPDFEIWAQQQRMDQVAPQISWSSYVQGMKDVATNDGHVHFVDLGSSFSTSVATDIWAARNADAVHLSDIGHQQMADEALEAMKTAVVAPIAVTSSLDTAFTPPSTNLLAWYDPSTITGLSNTDPISTWTPRAGSELAAFTQTSTNRPTFKTNRFGTLPSVFFTAASSQSMDTGAWSTSFPVPLTVFSVFRYTTLVGNLYTGRTGVFVYAGLGTGGGIPFGLGAGTAGELSMVETMDIACPHIVCTVYNGASTTVRLDNTRPTTTGTTGTGVNAKEPGAKVGTNSSTSGSYLDGELGDLLFYNGALTHAQIVPIMQYLSNKWGIPIM